ncbi:YqhG family protein [Sporolactobacillus sp. Y61]|jgi:hypothetical protein|uniref:YqhG family protein n=1 Tax=Sporolactobacillus sp. Y61 TaxID=3160863 RepID=A0AAU8IDV4_9BACL|nr:YqhG family protein [Sporolactobacillus sp. THM19-2]RYL87829.1 hypothetical protein EWH91_12215 [Sporolactobacillus sp. THM19-2]
MQPAAINQYLNRFFTVSGCRLLPETNGHVLSVKLTEEMDKILMNRPFYWHYIKQTGGTGETVTLRLRTNPHSDQDGEFIYFGAPRLHQIFDAARQLGSFIRLYQSPRNTSSAALEPWLCMNMRISYQCDLKKERLCSAGLQLINGTLIDGFRDAIRELPLSPKIPDYSYTLSPLIKIKSGMLRIESFIRSTLADESKDWAEEAGRKWAVDQRLLDAFYESEEDKPEPYFQEKEALRQQYQPKIQIQLINAGLFYLQSSSFLPGKS